MSKHRKPKQPLPDPPVPSPPAPPTPAPLPPDKPTSPVAEPREDYGPSDVEDWKRGDL